MRLGIAGFVKYLRKSPPDDTDIMEALTWVRDMVERVLGWEPVTDDDTAEPGADQSDLLDELTAQEAEDQLMNLDPSQIVSVAE